MNQTRGSGSRVSARGDHELDHLQAGGYRSGATTIALERGGATLVFKDVPARGCPNCGEAYVAEGVTEELLRTDEELVRAGTQVDVGSFSALA